MQPGNAGVGGLQGVEEDCSRVVIRRDANVETDRTLNRQWDNPLAWTAMAAAVLAARFPDWLRRPRLWAEDGNIFFLGATRDWHTDILKPYAGYLHLLPRTIAWIAHPADPSLVPALYVYSALLLTLCVVARACSARLDMPLRPLVALAIVAVPGTGEVFLCPTNIQWIAALLFPLTLIMRDPETAGEWAADIILLAAAGLTGPFSVFACPCFLWRALSRRTAASWTVALVVVATAAAQGWQLWFHPVARDCPAGAFRPAGLLAVLSAHIPLAFFGAQGWEHAASETVVCLLGLVGFAAIGATLLIRDRRRSQRIQLAAFAAIFVLCTSAKIRLDLWDYREVVNADRYFYIPKVIVLWLGASCLWRLRPAAVVVASLAAASLLAVDTSIPFVEGPLYVASHEERPYYDWKPYVGPIRKGQEVVIRTSPGWQFTLPQAAASR